MAGSTVMLQNEDMAVRSIQGSLLVLLGIGSLWVGEARASLGGDLTSVLDDAAGLQQTAGGDRHGRDHETGAEAEYLCAAIGLLLQHAADGEAGGAELQLIAGLEPEALLQGRLDQRALGRA